MSNQNLENKSIDELREMKAKGEAKLKVLHNIMTGLVGEIMKMPEAKAEIAKSIRKSSNKKGGRR